MLVLQVFVAPQVLPSLPEHEFAVEQVFVRLQWFPASQVLVLHVLFLLHWFVLSPLQVFFCVHLFPRALHWFGLWVVHLFVLHELPSPWHPPEAYT